MPCPLKFIALSLVAVAMSLSQASGQDAFQYPETKRIGHVDTYHGTEVADPYRWLEEDTRESADAAAWVQAQNKVTFAYLGSLPERKEIRDRLTELWNYERYSTPFKEGGRYYYFKNDGLQNQSVLYVLETLAGEARVLLDPNTWSADGTVALAGVEPSPDGKYIAYGVSEAGSDWQTWKVMEVATGRQLADKVEWVKYSTTTWSMDGAGFYYGRFDPPKGSGEEFQSLTYHQKLYYHRAGTLQQEDVLIYQRKDEPTWGFDASVSEDGRYLVISVWKGTDDNARILYQDLTEPDAAPIELIDNFENEYTFIESEGTELFFKTGLDAPRKRIIAIDVRAPERSNWREVVPERSDALQSVTLVGDRFIASYLNDAKTEVVLYAMDGKEERRIAFPAIGSASGFRGSKSDKETFYTFSSFATPPVVYRYDLDTGESTAFKRAAVDCDPNDYDVKQIFYRSGDGTRVPMFITHLKGLPLDGSNPTLLYGYGGFNISMTPSFSVSRLAWLERGGVYAVANLRGGGEYGEDWHKAGIKLEKQNVFDDFIAAAEWLIANRYASPDTLVIQGGSNGGLLVGAVMTQRPELFGVCLPAVGVMDMLRFHEFTAGRFWVDDYGSAENPEEFKALLAYSPYHNIKPGVAYPPTLITTADHDDRVVPGHSFKFAAALQHAQAGDGKVLIRIETRAGHGAGKPVSKRIEEIADQYAFALSNLKLNQ